MYIINTCDKTFFPKSQIKNKFECFEIFSYNIVPKSEEIGQGDSGGFFQISWGDIGQ